MRAGQDIAESDGCAEQLDHRLRPMSAGPAVPVSAFLAAGCREFRFQVDGPAEAVARIGETRFGM
jgi:hypothetical protein